MPLKLSIPARIPLLYVILGVLLAISVLPMYFYSAQIETMNRERLKTNEMLLQNTVTRSLADDISQHQDALPTRRCSMPRAKEFPPAALSPTPFCNANWSGPIRRLARDASTAASP